MLTRIIDGLGNIGIATHRKMKACEMTDLISKAFRLVMVGRQAANNYIHSTLKNINTDDAILLISH